MKTNRIITSLILIIIILFSSGCNKNNKTFLLEEKYYGSSNFIDLDKEILNNLIEKKESFALFIYQPLCSTSADFEEIITEFSNENKVSFYKMSFSDIKDTKLNEYIKYYPSFIIFKEGKIVDFLDANSNEDTSKYKNQEEFKTWFSEYVRIKKSKDNANNNTNTNNNSTTSNEKTDIQLETITYNKNKINIYFFWGDGCPHCEEEFKFFKSIEKEYGKYFTLNTFEVWHNEENAQILEQFATKMGDEVKGVPYTIIGNKTFKGFSSIYKEQMLEAITTQYKNSYDVYFENNK